MIYSVVCAGEKALISVETGHVYYFKTDDLLKKKKKPIVPSNVIDAHNAKTMRAIFFDSQIVSISNDLTFAIWDMEG